jgi:hypothetical protein
LSCWPRALTARPTRCYRRTRLKLDVLISIVTAELATARPERTFAAGKPVERRRVRITEAGPRALAELLDNR